MKKSIYILMIVTLISGCSTLVKVQKTHKANLSDIKSAVFLKGIKGPENIYLDKKSRNIFVTDLNGSLHLISNIDSLQLKIVKSIRIGNTITGITEGEDGFLYICSSVHQKKGWLTEGGAVYKVDKSLNKYTKITDNFKGINGLAKDSNGNLYFTVGNLKMLSPRGALYKIKYDVENKQYDKPVLFIDNLGSANGLAFSYKYNSLILTETFSKVSSINLSTKKMNTILDKTKLVEAFDDVAIDKQGRFWIAEPVGGFIKMFDPKNKKLIRFHINKIGVASSCRIINDNNNEEILFITEREFKKNNDGRGLIRIPIKELLQVTY